jgi:hypothetical protein
LTLIDQRPGALLPAKYRINGTERFQLRRAIHDTLIICCVLLGYARYCTDALNRITDANT